MCLLVLLSAAVCYDCILECVHIGGDHNVCPVPGCGVVLGPQPLEHNKLK